MKREEEREIYIGRERDRERKGGWGLPYGIKLELGIQGVGEIRVEIKSTEHVCETQDTCDGDTTYTATTDISYPYFVLVLCMYYN